MEKLKFETSMNASIEKVWEAISDRDQMKQWYFDLASFRPEVGFEFQFPGEGQKGDKYLHLCKVMEVIPHQKLSYSWIYKELKGYSVVTFELFPEGDRTRVKLTHEGIESFKDNGPDFVKENFIQGWTELIGTQLKKFVEKK